MALLLALKCPHHPRYNPIAGEIGIKGGCVKCMGLLELYHAYLTIKRSRFGEDEIEPDFNS